MIDDERMEKPARFLFGKEVIIAVVIIFSGLSFTLGYFVGSTGTMGETESVAPPIDAGQIPPQPEILPDQLPVKQAPEGGQGQAASPAGQGLSAPSDIRLSSAPSPRAKTPEQGAHGDEDAKQTRLRSEQTAKGADPSPAKGVAETSSQSEKASHTPEAIKQGTLYTVQIGAFSNASEARNLKTTFDKKGYTTYITVARDNKKRKVYKVKTGEFKERKDAAILALRLKKTEGLTTYVTAKSE